MSGRKCSVCTHPQRREIDRAIVSLSGSLRGIAARYGVTVTSLRRHRDNHAALDLAKAMRPELAGKIEDGHIGDLANHYREAVGRLKRLDTRAESILLSAERSNNLLAMIAAIREMRQLEGERRQARELLAKGQGELSPTAPDTGARWIICLPQSDADTGGPVIDATPEASQ